jgi:hypothetical protein
VKRTGRDEPIGAFTYIYLLTTQGNPLYFKLAKNHASLFTFKRNRFCWGGGDLWEGKLAGRGVGR